MSVAASADRTTVFLPLDPKAPAPTQSFEVVTPDVATFDDDGPTGWSKYVAIWKAHHHAPSQASIRRFLALPTDAPIDLRKPSRRPIPTYLPWSRGDAHVWHTPHFEIVTRLPEESLAPIASDLEQIYWAWTQLFFPLWSQSERVTTVLYDWNPSHVSAPDFLDQKTILLPNSTRHRVILLNDAADYRTTLMRPQIAAGDAQLVAASTGFYSDSLRAVFLYPDGDADSRRHEVCHQLFSEATSARPVPAMKVRNGQEFWLVEGIAGYFESMSVNQGLATFGGWDATRLQYARYRTLIQSQTLATESDLKGSAATLARRADIASWYNQSILRSHAQMDGFDFSKRRWLLSQLADVYGRTSPILQTQSTEAPSAIELRDFLVINDDHLQSNPSSAGAAAICLAGCPVTSKGIAAISPLHQVQWLDLSRTPVDDVALHRLLVNKDGLSQLSLEATRITSQGVAKLLADQPPLQELDLSWNQVDDSAMPTIGRLQQLETLWLTGCPISDQAIDSLSKLGRLHTLDVQRTGITEQGLNRLKTRFPQLSLNPLQLATSP